MKWPDQLRLTPVLMILATLLLSVKVQSVYSGVRLVAGVSRAQAESAPAPPPDKNSAEAMQKRADEMAKPTEAPPPPIAALPSAGELDVLQNLAVRRDQLEQRANELDLREKLLRAAEDRVGTKISELKKIEASIKALIEQQDALKEQELQNLVKVYSAMKPKEAAPIFDKLEMSVLISMIQRMPPNKIAPILAVMDPKRANDLTVKLATQKTLPDAAPEGLGDGGAGGSRPVPMVEAKPQAPTQTPSQAAQTQAAPPVNAANQLRPPGLLQPLPAQAARPPGSGG
jgi:flagellar motility protein MotE (MotC chaperone)